MIVLELFSGLECFSNACRRRNGYKCFTVDWDHRFPSSLHADISSLQVSDLPIEFQHPDIVFVGIDCTTYSIAAISHHRKRNETTGELEPVSDKAIFTDNMAIHVKDLIRQLDPKIQIWENPVGGLRKMSFMQDLKRNTTTYCQYGFSYRKGTDFFSNIDLHLKPPCKNGSPCHEKAPRGAKTGLQGIKDLALKSAYPPMLCDKILDECENFLRKDN